MTTPLGATAIGGPSSWYSTDNGTMSAGTFGVCAVNVALIALPVDRARTSIQQPAPSATGAAQLFDASSNAAASAPAIATSMFGRSVCVLLTISSKRSSGGA